MLGHAQLSNDGDDDNSEEAEAISFNFLKTVYWGTADGVARGLPTKVYENGAEVVELSGGWGFEDTQNITLVRAAHSIYYIYIQAYVPLDESTKFCLSRSLQDTRA